MFPVNYLLFLQIIIFLFITPGTPRIVIISYSMNYGVQKCVWTALGDVSANIVQATLVIFVLGSFFLDNPNSFISSGGLGVMGFEVPAAIGAQVGRPNATVWSICGAGGFQMTLQELATVVQEHLPIKYAIINNGYLGMVRQWQELFYEHRYKAVPISAPNFVKLAEAYGIPAATVTSKEDVDFALAKAADTAGPYLLNFVVAQEENVYPMVAPGASLAETIEDPRIAHRRQVVQHAPEGTVSYP